VNPFSSYLRYFTPRPMTTARGVGRLPVRGARVRGVRRLPVRGAMATVLGRHGVGRLPVCGHRGGRT
jgi:hypothetical protein